MLLIIFLLSYAGIKSAIWINHAAISSFGISKKKLSLCCLLSAVFMCFFCFWFSTTLIQIWIFLIFGVPMSRFLTFHLIKLRSRQIPERCLYEMDRMIVAIRTGQSIKQSLTMSLQREKSWFRMFLIELHKGFELHVLPATESNWFNRWGQEIIEIEKSRIKLAEQLEAIRRGIKVELDLQKKLKRVSDGPKTQAIFMGLLFVALNFLCLKSVTWSEMKILIPVAWIFFLIGLTLSWLIMRFFKWKI